MSPASPLAKTALLATIGLLAAAAAVHWNAISGPPIAIDFVLIRKAGAVALITHIDAPTVDSAVTEKVARAAAAKLK